MAKNNPSTKRLQISKANARIVVIIAGAAVLTTFSLVASRALLNQRLYQARVIVEKEKAAKQLKENRKAVESLHSAYTQFVTTPQNVIGGDTNGTTDRDGDSAKIILDALPSKYDFPALTTSIEKLLTEELSFKIDNISGTDDELAQAAQTSSTSPEPIEVPFEVSVSSNYDSLYSLFLVFELSIRPFHINTLTFSGDDQETQLIVNAHTYYQPAQSLDITTKEVK